MIIDVINQLKNVLLVFTDNSGKVNQSTFHLNVGLKLKAEYVQKTEDNKCNIHMQNGSVVVGVDRDALSYDKDANNTYIEKMSSGENQDPTNYAQVKDDVPEPKMARRGCCGR